MSYGGGRVKRRDLEAGSRAGSWQLLRYVLVRASSGALNLRVSPELHRAVTLAAKAAGKSLNQWAAGVLKEAAQH